MKNSSLTKINFILSLLFFITSLNAGYIPLTDANGHEKSWVLFGVTGLKITGAGAGTSSGVFSITDVAENKIIDLVKDEKFTDGLIVASKSFAKVKSLTIDYLQVRIDTTGKVFIEDEAVHSMYISLYKNAGPAFVITYKAILEGETMEYSAYSNGTNAYTITLDSSKTYSNPGYGELIQTVAGIAGSELKKIIDIIDFDLTDNPPSYQYYDKSLHQNLAIADQFIRIYSYDTKKTQWKLFDTRNSDNANDFDELKKGKAYWAQMDAVDNKQAGLVLGSDTISVDEYKDAGNGLVEGWNLLSFSRENSTIRKSSTALVLELKDVAGGLKIWDSVGNNFVEVSSVRGGDATKIKASCLAINQSIKEAKIAGNMDENFYLKAFIVGDANDKIVIISNKRFMIDEINDDSIGGVTTLLGKNPYTVNPLDMDNTDDKNAMLDLDNSDITKAVVSKYGEYAMIIEPLVGVGTASDKEAKIDLQSTADDAIGVEPIVIKTNMATVATDLTKQDFGGADFVSIAIDTDYDGSTDKVLIASNKTFYVRDHTFSRVFDYSVNGKDGKVTIKGSGKELATIITANRAITDVAIDINDADNNVYAKAIDPKIVIFTSQKNASKFDVIEDIGNTNHVDLFTDTTTDNNLAKGAIKGVYSLDTFATAPLNNILTINFDEFIDDADDTMSVLFTSTFGTKVVASATIGIATKYAVPSNDAEAVTYVANIEQQIKDELSLLNIVGSVVTTGHEGTLGDKTWTVTIISQYVKDVNIDYTNANADGVAETDIADSETPPLYGELVTPSADLTSDLKFTPINVPNYVVNGPLYTIKKAGFDLKAMVGGSTNLSTGTVSWESIDLTRPPSEWLSSQDYNLFSTDSSAGYWVYVKESEAVLPADKLTIKKTTFSPIYTTHFNTDGTTYNNISGQISVEIENLPQYGESDYDNSSIIELLVNGSAIELINKSSNNVYLGDISSYELPILSGNNYPIHINVSDGIGTNLLNQDSGKIIDFKKPTTPIVDINATNGNNDEGSLVKIESSSDVIGYYVFNGQIPDYNPSRATNKVAEFDKSVDNLYTICSGFGINKLTTANQDAYDLNIIAVDGTGKLGGGNASDIIYQAYIPMLKNSIKLEDTNEDGDEIAQTLGRIYGADCKYIENQTVNYGMQIRSETNANPDETVKIAYEPKNGGLANPTTIYFEGINDSQARVIYADSYVNSIIYIMVDDKVYSYKLLSSDDAIGKDDEHPIDLEIEGTVTKRPNQKL